MNTLVRLRDRIDNLPRTQRKILEFALWLAVFLAVTPFITGLTGAAAVAMWVGVVVVVAIGVVVAFRNRDKEYDQ